MAGAATPVVPVLARVEGNFSPNSDATEKFRLKGSHNPRPPRKKRKVRTSLL